jgi:hypothetical protein
VQNQQAFGDEAKKRPFVGSSTQMLKSFRAGGLLDNNLVQSAARLSGAQGSSLEIKQQRIYSTASLNPPPSKLELLKKQRFKPEHKTQRVAKSLAALNKQSPINLSPEEWQHIAEDADIEDQFE